MNFSYASLDEKMKTYQQITPNRIMEIANEIFVLDNMLTTIKTNQKTFNYDAANAIIKLGLV